MEPPRHDYFIDLGTVEVLIGPGLEKDWDADDWFCREVRAPERG
jgi:hypothetical protein